MSSKIVEALELALRLSAQTNDEFTEHDRALIESALAEARAAVSAEPVAWAISYDGKTPYQLFSSEDCYLLDCEVKRIGGTACKIPLFTAPPPVSVGAEPVAWQARQLSEAGWGHWFEVDERSLKQYAKKERWEVRALGVIAPPPAEAPSTPAERYTVETFSLPRTSEFQSIINNGIRITDKETGRVVEVASERTAHANAAKAWEQIKASPVEASQQQAEPASGVMLDRYGVEWQGPTSPICKQMSDGYWTPWHIAYAELSRLTAELSDVSGRSAEIATKAADEIERLTAELDAAKAAVAALRKDAERYRWMRDGPDGQVYEVVQCFAEEWDAAIDAAIAAQRRENREGGE